MNTPHRHGGSPIRDFKRFGLKEGQIIDFSVNLNALGPPAIIRERWDELLAEIGLYPDIEGRGICEYSQKKLGLPPENLLAGNGNSTPCSG